DENPALGLAVADSEAEPLREVGVVVVRVGAVTAQVRQLMARGELSQAVDQLALERRSRVIGCECNPHRRPSPSGSAVAGVGTGLAVDAGSIHATIVATVRSRHWAPF